jgi:hypothetical protein
MSKILLALACFVTGGSAQISTECGAVTLELSQGEVGYLEGTWQ